MFLKKINYWENKEEPNYWEVKDVILGKINIIIGLNATGKTRFCNVISNLAKFITKKAIMRNGSWHLTFITDDKLEFIYELELQNRKIIYEKMSKNGKVYLERGGEGGKILSCVTNDMVDFSPPSHELTLSVRRDKKEYPFLEELYEWADNFYGYKFTCSDPNQINVPNTNVPGSELENLGRVPYLLSEAMNTPGIIDEIVKDFTDIGYPIDGISASKTMLPGVPIIEVKEKALKCSTVQFNMSQGMYRALSIIIILEYILRKNIRCTIAVDDLGEGLDYERSNKIMQLLMKKIKDSSIQLIVTSNQNYLVNEANFEYLNFLERNGHQVCSYNYENSKEKFKEFEMLGLSNFDFFIRKLYREN